MLVIGGHNSANTLRLVELCCDITKTKHIETAEDINHLWFKNKKKVGITAGASTPNWVIKEVIDKIKKY